MKEMFDRRASGLIASDAFLKDTDDRLIVLLRCLSKSLTCGCDRLIEMPPFVKNVCETDLSVEVRGVYAEYFAVCECGLIRFPQEAIGIAEGKLGGGIIRLCGCGLLIMFQRGPEVLPLELQVTHSLVTFGEIRTVGESGFVVVEGS